jgi:hypothetical protein
LFDRDYKDIENRCVILVDWQSDWQFLAIASLDNDMQDIESLANLNIVSQITMSLSKDCGCRLHNFKFNFTQMKFNQIR